MPTSGDVTLSFWLNKLIVIRTITAKVSLNRIRHCLAAYSFIRILRNFKGILGTRWPTEQGLHHTTSPRRLAILCSICVHSIGALTKAVWLFIASLHNQSLYPKFVLYWQFRQPPCQDFSHPRARTDSRFNRKRRRYTILWNMVTIGFIKLWLHVQFLHARIAARCKIADIALYTVIKYIRYRAACPLTVLSSNGLEWPRATGLSSQGAAVRTRDGPGLVER